MDVLLPNPAAHLRSRQQLHSSCVCNQMCINCTVVSQARPHKSFNTQLVPHGGRLSVNPNRMPPLSLLRRGDKGRGGGAGLSRPCSVETVQDMFITPLCQHHPSHTLASRAYGLQPHMRSSSATRPYIYTVCNFIYKVYFYIFYYRIQYEFKDGVYLPKRNSFYASTITLGCPRPSFENPFAGHAVSMLSMF